MALNEEDHDLLTRIDERVERIDARMDSHSKSLDSLERFRSRMLGGIGALTVIIGFIIGALKWQ